jgi:hypothetical protein
LSVYCETLFGIQRNHLKKQQQTQKKRKGRTEKVNQFFRDNNSSSSGNSGGVGNDDGDVRFHEFVLTYNATPMKPGKAFSLATTKILGKPISQGIFRKIFETRAHDAGLTDKKGKHIWNMPSIRFR